MDQSVMGDQSFTIQPRNGNVSAMRSLPDAFETAGGEPWQTDEKPWNLFQRKPVKRRHRTKKKTHTSDVWSKYVLLIFGKHVPFKDDKRWRCYQNFFELTVSPKVVVCFRGPSQLARTPHRWSFPTPPFVFRFVGPLACGELWGWASEESFTANSLSETNSGFCEKPLKNGSFMKP